MPRKRRRSAGVVDLPKGVHRVVSRGREYFYWQAGRGSSAPGKRTRLPDDPHDPEFWVALRQAQGAAGAVIAATIGSIIDLYETSPHFRGLAVGTRDQYGRALRHIRDVMGGEDPDSIRPVHVRGVLDDLADTPGRANTVLGTLRAFNAWALERGHFGRSITEGVRPFAKQGGHRPWSDAQIAVALAGLSGGVRRAVLLALYTGQRGSDVVRLGPTDLDDGGFRLAQKKTGREVWCPVVPELAAEMDRWERRPGPFVLRPDGKAYRGAKLLSIHFREATESIPELAEATLHGLRCTAVVRLRRAGLSSGQIGDIVGMSLAMIERYCRFADRKTSGQAALIQLTSRRTKAERE